MFLTLMATAWGATLTVDAAGSTNYSTIQSAVNAASNGDTIKVKPGTYDEGVDTKGKNLTIKANGTSANTTIDATGETFSVSVESGTVTLQGFTFTGGASGLEVRGATVTASDIVVEDVTGEAPGGGFLFAGGATVTIDDCSVDGVDVQNNQYGGGFFIEASTATISNCDVTNNTAYQGGGFYIYESTVDLTDVTVEGNTVGWKGGGLRIRENSKVTGLRLTVESNESDDLGGGINAEDSDISCQNCKVWFNKAGGSGGGMSIDGSKTNAGSKFTGANSTFQGNSTDQAAGGIYSTNTDLQVQGIVKNNKTTATSTVRGVGIYFTRGDLLLKNVTVSGHTSDEGGAVWVGGTSGETLTITGATFSSNTAEGGDGGAIYSEANTTVSTSTFDGNEASSAGGALFLDEAWLIVEDSSFTSNKADVKGGAINVYKHALTAKRNDFVGNEAADGGALYFHGGGLGKADATLSKNAFDSNTATGRGGGVNSNGADSWSSANSTYSGNDPEGMQVTGASFVLIKNDLFKNNASDGMVLSNIANGRTESSRFLNNGGDGAYYSASKNHLIVASTFIENAGTGITLAVSDAGMRIENCDAVANGEAGMAVEFGNGDELVNNIAAFNGEQGFIGTSATPDLAYNNANGNNTNYGGTVSTANGSDGNISKDPEYTGFSDDSNGVNDILFLGSTSPCRNTGDPSLTDSDGSRSDMGSFGGAYASDTDDDNDGYKPSDGDCDNSDASIHPGANDTWYDGIDSDCDGADDYDRDGDGYRDPSGAGDDCDDTDPDIHPGANDPEGDGVDSDCDGNDGGSTDDTGVVDDTGDPTDDTDNPDDTGVGWFSDNDADGYSPSQGDCDDDDVRVNPLAAETCDDEIDNDCDGFIDSEDADCTGSAECAGCASSQGPAIPVVLAGLFGLLLVRRR